MSPKQNKQSTQSALPNSLISSIYLTPIDSDQEVTAETPAMSEKEIIFTKLTADVTTDGFFDSLDDIELGALCDEVYRQFGNRYCDNSERLIEAEKQVDTLNAEVQRLGEKLATIKASI